MLPNKRPSAECPFSLRQSVEHSQDTRCDDNHTDCHSKGRDCKSDLENRSRAAHYRCHSAAYGDAGVVRIYMEDWPWAGPSSAHSSAPSSNRCGVGITGILPRDAASVVCRITSLICLRQYVICRNGRRRVDCGPKSGYRRGRHRHGR